MADSGIMLFRLGAAPPPCALCEPEVFVFPLRAVFFVSRVLDGHILIFFFSSILFFDFDLDIVCFILSFSCGYYAVSSLSVSAATRSAYGMCLDTCIR